MYNTSTVQSGVHHKMITI